MKRLVNWQQLMRHFRLLGCLAAEMILLATMFDTYRGSYGFTPSGIATKRSEFSALAKVIDRYDHLPLALEENHGQIDSGVRFFSRGKTINLYLKSSEVVLTSSANGNREGDHSSGSQTVDQFLSLKLKGAKPDPQITGEERLQSATNYLVGRDPKRWRTNVDNFNKVRYRDVYPGIDAVYYGNQLGLEYDFIVSPGIDYRIISISFEGLESIAIDASDALVLHTSRGEIRQHKPIAYQEINGFRTELPIRYVLLKADVSSDTERSKRPSGRNNQVSFEVEHYDPRLPLVIDPVLSYSTYLGGGTRDEANAVAVDSSGNLYITGYTNSANFPMITTSQVASGDCLPCGNVFVTKLNSSGTAALYTTILGGSLSEATKGISIDSLGNAYITGYTFSRDFPVTVGAFQRNKRSPDDDTDVFVAKLNPAGTNLVYSTYLGGSRNNQASSIATAQSGEAYVTGYTFSDDFPTTSNAFQTSRGGSNPFFSDAFVTKLDPQGSGLSYSTYLGGIGIDRGNCVAVDSFGNAYVTGKAGAGFPTTFGAFQPEMKGGNDAFVTKLRSEDGALVYSTYLGGTSGAPDGVPCPGEGACQLGDEGWGIAVDFSGSAYITGGTSSVDFPSTPGSFHTDLNSSSTLFVTKLNREGNALVYSAIGIGGISVAVDPTGSAYVTGTTSLDSIPMLSAFQGKRKGRSDAYIEKLSSTGSVLVYSSYLGGGDDDFSNAIAVDDFGNAYVAGYTVSENFKIRSALQPIFGGQNGGTGSINGDAFVAKIALPRIVSVSANGKKLFVTGENFDDGAVILLNGQKQKTSNDEERPDSLLVGKKAGLQIPPGQSGTLQVRNSDDTLSAEFVFTRPVD